MASLNIWSSVSPNTIPMTCRCCGCVSGARQCLHAHSGVGSLGCVWQAEHQTDPHRLLSLPCHMLLVHHFCSLAEENKQYPGYGRPSTAAESQNFRCRCVNCGRADLYPSCINEGDLLLANLSPSSANTSLPYF